MPPESSKLDENTLAKLESSNWQERKEVLEVISNQLKCSTLADTICGLVTKALCQVITSDKHSMLVIRAAVVLSEVAESMKNGFVVHSERALTACLLKFKDTKANLSQALRLATTAIVDTMPFDLALVQLQTALNNTPVAKTQTEALRLLAHLFCKSNLRQELQLSQRLKISKPFLTNVAKFSQHKTPECRDACFQVFAANRIFLNLNSKQFNDIIDNMLDESRRVKVDAAFAQLNEGILRDNIANTNSDSPKLITKSKSKGSHFQQQQQQQLVNDFDFPVTPIRASPSISNKPGKTGKQALHKILKSPTRNHISSSTPFSTNQKPALHDVKQNVKISASKLGPSKIPSSIKREGLKQPPGRGKTKVGNQNGTKPKVDSFQPQDLNLSPNHLRNKLSETYFVNLPLEQLTDTSWKIRLQITERINAIIDSTPPEYPDIHYLSQYILHCGTVKDTNFRVRCEILNILSKLLSRNQSQNWIPTNLMVSLCDQLFATIGDSKSGPLVEQTLRHLMNVIGFPKIVECIYTGLKKHVSPTIHSSLIKWLSSSVKSLNSNFDHQLPIEIVKFGLASPSPDVRGSAIELAGALYACLHSTINIRSFFSSEKPAILQRLEAEFANIDKNTVSPSDSKNNSSTCYELEALTPAAVEAWSVKERRMTALIGPISPLQRLTNAEGVLEFSDSDESPIAERSSVPYKKGFIEAVTKQPTQQENVDCVVGKTTYVTSSNISDTIFFVESNDETSLLQTKEIRLENLKKHKMISKDELQHLFDESHIHPNLKKHLFSTSYESHLEALDRLISSLNRKDTNTIPSPLIVTYAHFDLILMWIEEYCFGYWLKGDFQQSEYNDCKTVLGRAFDYLTAVISLFAQNDLRLSEQEVNIILIPLLNCQLQSVTVYKDSVIYRNASDSIHLIRQVYPPSLLMDILVKYMHQCSTAKMRQICLEELLSLIPRSVDPRGFTSELCLKLIAQQLADSDSGVKKSALNCLCVAYKSLGPLFWQHVGNLPEKDKRLLEQYLSSSNTDLTSAVSNHVDEFSIKTPFQFSTARDTSIITAPYTGEYSRTKRPESPPPLHLSPAAPSLLLPLITARDNPSLSESDRIAASNQLTVALSCLVDQLGGFVLDDNVQDENRIPPTDNYQVYTDENEDDRSGFNNIVLGALIDLEVLIQDPRTCNLLPPFMPQIITQLTLLCNRLYKSESNAGQAIFMDCLGGELICIFTQPFLYREVKADDLKYLLGGLIQLAERLQLNRNTPFMLTNPRIITIMKLVRYIYTAVDPSIGLSVLLRLVHICCFGCDILCHQTRYEGQNIYPSDPMHRMDEPFPSDMKSVSFSKVANLSLAQLACRSSEIRNYINKIDWALILPLLESFLPNSSHETKPIKIKSHQAIRMEILQKTVKVIQCILIESYGCIGPKLIDEIEKYKDQCPSLLHIMYTLKSVMHDVPYPHCHIRSDKHASISSILYETNDK
ncbi:unnamed protein product [Schistosoma turkestanicum]|nr:unnamed protein product [Schistosoma turkestanicum]